MWSKLEFAATVTKEGIYVPLHPHLQVGVPKRCTCLTCSPVFQELHSELKQLLWSASVHSD